MKLYLVRHALTKDIQNGIVQSDDSEIIVNKDTLKQVADARSVIGKVDKVYCSPNKRTMQTADLLFGKDNYEVLKDTYEFRHPKSLIGKTAKEKATFYKKYKVQKYNLTWKTDSGESVLDIFSRVIRLILKLEKLEYESVAFVGNATFMRYILCVIGGVTLLDLPKMVIDVLRQFEWKNLQVVELEI